MLHHPSDFAMETSPTILLSAGQETFVAIYPTDLRCSEQVLALPEAQRKCINPWDYEWMETYRQSSCILDCFREAVHGTCQCHPYNLPEKSLYGRQRPIRECNLIDGLCLVKNYGELGRGGPSLANGIIHYLPLFACSKVQDHPVRLPAAVQRCDLQDIDLHFAIKRGEEALGVADLVSMVGGKRAGKG